MKFVLVLMLLMSSLAMAQIAALGDVPNVPMARHFSQDPSQPICQRIKMECWEAGAYCAFTCGLSGEVVVLSGEVVVDSVQDLPDAPRFQSPPGTVCIGPNSCGWHQVKEVPPAPVTFWTFRGVYKDPTGRKQFNWNAPPLRTNRQTFNRKFLILHGMAAAAMIVACKRKNSGEDFGSEAPAVAAITGLDYLMSRFFTEAMSVEAPPYMIQHYVRSAAK